MAARWSCVVLAVLFLVTNQCSDVLADTSTVTSTPESSSISTTTFTSTTATTATTTTTTPVTTSTATTITQPTTSSLPAQTDIPPVTEAQPVGPGEPAPNGSYPIISSVTLSGPTVINRLWIEFYCDIATLDTDPNATFGVQFLFYGNRYDVPEFTTNLTTLSVPLHERFLTGKIGTSLSCSVTSYYASTPSMRSAPVFSNSYMLQITPSISWMVVTESDSSPALVYIQSTLPITCSDDVSAAGPVPCSLAMDVRTSSDDIAVFQASLSASQACKYLLYEDDWNVGNSVTHNQNKSLAVIAKSDPYISGPRYGFLTFQFPSLPSKTAGGFTYTPFWSQQGLTYNPWIYRYDASSGLLTCTATADVHWTTFDGLFFSSYGEGVFIYSRSLDGQPFEVQARQGSCLGPFTPFWITCVCGVAVREDNAILILDACQDGILRAVGWNHRTLPPTSGIFSDGSGWYFKIQMPSGNKVYVQYWYPIMNIRIAVVGQPRIRGLCGSPDGDPSNDLIVQDTAAIMPPLSGGWAGPQAPLEVVDSWGLAKGMTLFEGYLAPLPSGPVIVNNVQVPPTSTYPICTSSTNNYYSLPAEPNQPVNVLTPRAPPITVVSARKRRRRSVSTTNTNNFDDQYDPSQITTANTSLVEVTWPTDSGITEQQARDECRSKIVNTKNLGSSCMDIIANETQDAEDAVSKCVLDVQLTGNFSWANDKVAELQKSCYFRAIGRNNSELNDTAEAIALAVSASQEVSAAVCSPFDCNEHGDCINGACVCSADYIGADCAVSQNAIPTAVRLLTTTDCDIDRESCNIANVHATNAANVGTLSCRIVVTTVNGSSTTYVTSGRIETALTVTCPLPLEPLNYTAAVRQFAETNYPGYNFYCLPLGSPVLEYSISISNNGNQFSNSLTMRVVDTMCMNCTDVTGTACSLLPDTCLINGYCFETSVSNPYDSSLACQPGQSTSLWSNQQGPVPLEGSCDPIDCSTVVSELQQAQDSTYSCVPRNATCTFGGSEIDIGSSISTPNCQTAYCVQCPQCAEGAKLEYRSNCNQYHQCRSNSCKLKVAFRVKCARALKKVVKQAVRVRCRRNPLFKTLNYRACRVLTTQKLCRAQIAG